MLQLTFVKFFIGTLTDAVENYFVVHFKELLGKQSNNS